MSTGPPSEQIGFSCEDIRGRFPCGIGKGWYSDTVLSLMIQSLPILAWETVSVEHQEVYDEYVARVVLPCEELAEIWRTPGTPESPFVSPRVELQPRTCPQYSLTTKETRQLTP
jgi:hypothetical protein